MKQILPSLMLVLAGCQTPTVPEPVAIALPPPTVAPVPPEPTGELRRQRQLVEALMSQNEALQTKLRKAGRPSASLTHATVSGAEAVTRPEPATVVSEPINFLMPNADGVIDLVAAAVLAAGDTINPFELRQPTTAGEEILLTIQGVVRGEHPCALVNDRVLAIGDQLDGLRLERIEAETLFFVVGEFTLRVPVNGGPVRVRRS